MLAVGGLALPQLHSLGLLLAAAAAARAEVLEPAPTRPPRSCDLALLLPLPPVTVALALPVQAPPRPHPT